MPSLNSARVRESIALVEPVPFFPYRELYLEDREAHLGIIDDVYSRGAFILGEDHDRFEKELASYLGVKHAIAVANGTDAILLALMAAGVGVGDEVITVSHTFVATIEVIHALGATPVFVDILDDHGMDVHAVEAARTPASKAVLPVQLNGHITSDMAWLRAWCAEEGVALIEDAAQAFGAKQDGTVAGAFGLAGCFSFYPAKLLGAFGDAGAVVTNDDQTAEYLRLASLHGRGHDIEVRCWGLNCRMDNVQAALLSHRLRRVPEWTERRRAIALQYHEGLCHLETLSLPPSPGDGASSFDVFQNYELEAVDRDALRKSLLIEGIHTSLPWGGKAVHEFSALGFSHLSLPRTEQCMRRSLMLPMHHLLTDAQVSRVVTAIHSHYA